ncbi:hypothetical protein [Pseudobacter ginsenosidimutans]|jgi:hypothetical protein|uniref:Parallel beta helix pectate lyase-like protein n=1 Tax=Pseudobacter ginsenosidimutans TaxID=661488 RepID=A0A4Q7N1I8_9BACT|nr:hypothetical protein [Pseudobacter ginsenosidimutans]QEC44071.1 hypothetical protein FSB84_21195 [Pseudobacter ginsenosidimutans]RZS75511.1 hypothetical protein EV199_1380 [Pseudobacter ginsenosidimutans]
MKLFQFTGSILLCIIVSVPATAKIWRVNNNPGIDADFTSVQAAHNAAEGGDTIHVEGSASRYGRLTISKRVYIIGPGYYLDQVPNTQVNMFSAVIEAIDFNTGAENSVVMGIECPSDVNINCHKITLMRNRLMAGGIGEERPSTPIRIGYGAGTEPANDIIISQNYGGNILVLYGSTRILISNNYLTRSTNEGDATTFDVIGAPSSAILIVKNNVLRRGRLTTYNSSYSNNIMINGSVNNTTTGNLFLNNIGSEAQFGTANGNQSNVSMANVFVGRQTGVSWDGEYMLRAGSPAIGAGEGSTPQNPIDCGMFGGLTKYVLAGQPPMPAIYSLEVSPVGSLNEPVKVKAKVKSAGK